MIDYRTLTLTAWLLGGLSLWIYQGNSLTALLLLLLLGIVVITVKGCQLLLVVVLFFVFALYFSYDQNHLQKQSQQQASKNQPQFIQANADQWTISDQGRLTGVGRLKKQKAAVYFTYQSQSRAEFSRLQRETGRVELSGQADLQAILPATNDYQFDFRQFSKTKHVTHQVYFRNLTCQPVVARDIFQKMDARFHYWHALLIHRAQRLPKPLAQYALVVLLGFRDQTLYLDSPKLQELGLIHLFSLSGFHVAFLLTVLRQCLRWFGLYREITLLVLALALFGFYWLTAGPPILVRALVAGECRLVGELFQRRLPPLTIWSWSLILTLLIQPMILLTLGGQLSFMLTLALSLLPKNWQNWQKVFFLSWLTFPFLLAQQYTWNIWQGLANLLAVPVFVWVILPAVCLGFIGQGWPFLVSVANLLVTVFNQVVTWFGSWPGLLVIGDITWPILFILALLPWFFFSTTRSCQCRLVLSWALLLLFGYSLVRYAPTGEFTTFDIGQGDAALLREPYNRTVTLIDTGGKVGQYSPAWLSDQPGQVPSRLTSSKKQNLEIFNKNKAVAVAAWPRSVEGMARAVIVPYLHARGISRINTLSLSHQDQDHIGDARVILTAFRVDQVLVPAGMGRQRAFQQRIQPYLGTARVVEVTDQVHLTNCPLQVLYPFDIGEGTNEESIALAGRLGHLVFFSAGDLDQAGEKKIRDRYPNFRPDIVKFGHHGSKTATNPAVMAWWQPSYGLISAGRHNRYGHPHAEVLATANRQGMIVYDTRRQGMLRYEYKNHNKGHFQIKNNNDLKNITTTN